LRPGLSVRGLFILSEPHTKKAFVSAEKKRGWVSGLGQTPSPGGNSRKRGGEEKMIGSCGSYKM